MSKAPTPRIIKRSVSIAGHATSISLEEPFWAELKSIAMREKTSLAQLIRAVDDLRSGTNLSSALRLHVLDDLKKRAGDQA